MKNIKKILPLETVYLHCNTEVVIPATNGTRLISETAKFRLCKNMESCEWEELGNSNMPTEEVLVRVYDTWKKDASFAQMFGFSEDLNNICFENQEQIIKFCEESPDIIHKWGHKTLFLFKNEDGKFFVIYMDANTDDFSGYLYSFENNKSTYRFECDIHVIVPWKL